MDAEPFSHQTLINDVCKSGQRCPHRLPTSTREKLNWRIRRVQRGRRRPRGPEWVLIQRWSCSSPASWGTNTGPASLRHTPFLWAAMPERFKKCKDFMKTSSVHDGWQNSAEDEEGGTGSLTVLRIVPRELQNARRSAEILERLLLWLEVQFLCLEE